MALSKMLRVAERGLIHAGLPCASYTWISSSVHKRTHARPMGDETNPWVVQQNILAARLMLLLLTAVVRRVHFLIEHPGCSRLPRLPFVRAVMSMFAADAQLACNSFQVRWLLASTFWHILSGAYDIYKHICGL